MLNELKKEIALSEDAEIQKDLFRNVILDEDAGEEEIFLSEEADEDYDEENDDYDYDDEEDTDLDDDRDRDSDMSEAVDLELYGEEVEVTDKKEKKSKKEDDSEEEEEKEDKKEDKKEDEEEDDGEKSEAVDLELYGDDEY